MEIFHKFVSVAHVYVELCMCVRIYACVCYPVVHLWMCGCITEKGARQSRFVLCGKLVV